MRFDGGAGGGGQSVHDASGLLTNFVPRGPRSTAARGLAGAVVGAVDGGDHVAAKAAAKALLSFVEELDTNEEAG